MGSATNLTPRTRHSSENDAIAAEVQETTILDSPLTAAIQISARSGIPSMIPLTFDSSEKTASMDHFHSSLRSSLHRSKTAVTDSSKSSIPDTYAAANSPCECPNTAEGRMPDSEYALATAHWMANIATQATSIRDRDSSERSPQRTSFKEKPNFRSQISDISSTLLENPEEAEYSSFPIHTYWHQ